VATEKILESPTQLHLPFHNGVIDKPFARGTFLHKRKTKATNEQIIESYSRLNNVWKVAKEFGMCGQSVHERLSNLGVINKMRKMTIRELSQIKEVYESGIIRGDGKLEKLSQEINRTIPFISRFAREMGLTTYSRKHTNKLREMQAKNMKLFYKTHTHPKGFLNHTHNKQAREKIAYSSVLKWMSITKKEHLARVMKARKTTMERGSEMHSAGDSKKSWKAQWLQVGPHYHYFRSSWEIIYAQYLQEKWDNEEIRYWEPEESTFWFEDSSSNVRSYKPDFTVYENDYSESFHEVKGYMDDRSKKCLELMAKEYPNIKLIVIDSKRFKQLFGKETYYYKLKNI
jgi:hypothetical protein